MDGTSAQELSAEFENFARMQNSVDGAVSEDLASKARVDTKMKAMLGGDECPVLNCRFKLNASNLGDEVIGLKKERLELVQDNERLRKTLEKTATPQDLSECLTNVLRDKQIAVYREELDLVRCGLESKDRAIADLRNKNDDLKKELEQYGGMLETDRKLWEQFQQLKMVEEQCARMRAWYKEAHTKGLKIRSRFEDEKLKLFKVREQTEEALREYEHMKEMVKQAGMVLKKGFAVNKVAPISGGKPKLFGGFRT